MNENDGPEAVQDYVRSARKSAAAQPVSQSPGMKAVTDGQLDAGVLAPDTGHLRGAGVRSQIVQIRPRFDECASALQKPGVPAKVP